MKKILPGLMAAFVLVLVFALTGCQDSSESGEGEHVRAETGGAGEESGEHNSVSESGNASEASGEHSGEGEASGEHEEEGEESGTQFALGDTFDEVRAGARLVLSYDSTANSFTGTVENTTAAKLSRVRVEVHLSNGIELGPTTPVDLDPGQIIDITLEASGEPFTTWSAHPEVN